MHEQPFSRGESAMKQGQPFRMVSSIFEHLSGDLGIVHQNNDTGDGIFDTHLTPTVKSIDYDLS